LIFICQNNLENIFFLIFFCFIFSFVWILSLSATKIGFSKPYVTSFSQCWVWVAKKSMKTDLHSIIIDRKFNSRFKLLIEKLSANFWSLSFIIMQKEFDLTQSFYLSLSFVKWSVIWSISPTCLRADFTSPDPKSAKNSQVNSVFCAFEIYMCKSCS